MKLPEYKIGDIVIIEPTEEVRKDYKFNTVERYPKYFEGVICSVKWNDICEDWHYEVKASPLGEEEYFPCFNNDIIKVIK